MKKYILMSCGISDIGGGQIYYYNKVKYCEQNGWKVYVFSGVSGKIYIDKLKEHENLRNEALKEYPYMYSSGQQKKTLKWMLACIDYHQEDEIIIESGNSILAVWGELLSKLCNGKNIVNILDEKIYVRNKSVYNYLEFKWKRREFRCIKPKIMQTFFSEKALTQEQCYEFRAPCTNSMEDVSIPSGLDLSFHAPVIGIIGRIEKEYVFNAIKETVLFAKKHSDKFYNILIVGGGDRAYYNLFNKLVKNEKNVKLVITGKLYPVPQKLIEKIDVAIGSSGSIRLPWSLDIPSISVELNSGLALGFLGYDTVNTQFALNNEELRSISDCLEDFFFNSYIDKNNGKYETTHLVTQEEIDDVLKTHFEYISLSASEKEYFDEFKAEGIKENFLKMMYSLLGHKMVLWLKSLKSVVSVKQYFE